MAWLCHGLLWRTISVLPSTLHWGLAMHKQPLLLPFPRRSLCRLIKGSFGTLVCNVVCGELAFTSLVPFPVSVLCWHRAPP